MKHDRQCAQRTVCCVLCLSMQKSRQWRVFSMDVFQKYAHRFLPESIECVRPEYCKRPFYRPCGNGLTLQCEVRVAGGIWQIR